MVIGRVKTHTTHNNKKRKHQKMCMPWILWTPRPHRIVGPALSFFTPLNALIIIETIVR